MKTDHQFFKLVVLAFILMVMVNFLAFDQPKIHQLPADQADQEILSFSVPRLKEREISTSLVFENPEKIPLVSADLVVNFDPQALIFLDFEPGQYFQEPVVLAKEVDQAKGQLRIALFTANSQFKESSGSLVDFRFLLAEPKIGQSLKINVSKAETILVAKDKAGNNLGETRDFNYQIVEN